MQNAASLLISSDVPIDALMAQTLLALLQQPSTDLLEAPTQVQLLRNQCHYRKRHLSGTARLTTSFTALALSLLVVVPALACVAFQLSGNRRLTHANVISDGLLAETAFIQSFNLASLLVGQLLIATHFTYLLPEKNEASLQAAGLFF